MASPVEDVEPVALHLPPPRLMLRSGMAAEKADLLASYKSGGMPRPETTTLSSTSVAGAAKPIEVD